MRAILAVLVLAAVAGCDVGEVPPLGSGNDPASGVDAGIGGGGGNQAAAEQSFETTIAPLVGRCTACHGTSLPPNLTSFDTLDARYKTKPGASNILVTEADSTGGEHNGITYFSTADKATVAGWIDSLP